MASGKTHPHVDRPTQAQLRTLVRDKAPLVREIYLAAHKLILESLPDVAFSVDATDRMISYGVRQYGYDGWGMAALAPFRNWATLGFLRGALLDDPAGLLEGTSRLVRHVKLRSLEQLQEQRGALRKLLEAASRVNQE